MAVVGGAGSVWGAVVGVGVVLTLKDQLQDVMPRLVGPNMNVELLVFGVLMVLVLQYARDGIWPVLARAWGGLTGVGRRSRPARVAPGVRRVSRPLARRDQPPTGSLVLKVEGARKEFGGLVAVNDIDFELRAGEIMGLIGPNGAGKSTTFDLISGVKPLTSGAVHFMGRRIDGGVAHDIARLGVGRTFQHVQLLSDMTVLENVALGAHLRSRAGVVAAALHIERDSEAALMHEAALQLRRVGLGDYLTEQAGNLPLGSQRLLEIARALASDPLLLLLDEPAAGLRYREKQELARVLDQLRGEGMSLLLVEHDMDFVMNLTDHLVVMDFGTKIAEGKPEEIQRHPAVLEAYLGGLDDEEKALQAVVPAVSGSSSAGERA
jgi:branched-chain amino acid transport system permease protein